MKPLTHFQQRYGPWALVTGASDGIGRAFALEAARLRLHVALVARRQDRLETLAKEIESSHHVSALVISCDLSTQTGQDTVKKATEDLDVGLLIAAAGFGTSGPILHANLERERVMLELRMSAAANTADVARASFAALGRQTTVVPGLLSKLLTYSLATLPRSGRTRIMGRVMKGMTKHRVLKTPDQAPTGK